MFSSDPTARHPWRTLASALESASATVRAAQPLSELTTFRIGGPAGLVCPVENADQGRRFLDFARDRDLPWVCLGAGSNILADDAGFAGLVMLMTARRLDVHGDAVRAGAGWIFDDLVAATLREGLVGLEFASGIPGTLGGALVGNAGCYGREIGSFLVDATVLRPDGGVETLGPEDFAFAYRDSALKGRGDLVLEITLKLSRGDVGAAGAVRDGHIADRRRKHPWNVPCAGSYFKNLPPLAAGGRRRAAGELLDAVGAKTMREGDATVFPGHANIIVNAGQATARDVLNLADRMKDAVRDRFGEDLEPEVRHLTTPGASHGPAAD